MTLQSRNVEKLAMTADEQLVPYMARVHVGNFLRPVRVDETTN